MTAKLKLACVCLSAAFGLNPALAEDIDIYTQTTTNSAPNVLLFIDNSSNWSANNQAWDKADVKAKCGTNAECLKYTEIVFGSSSSLVQGQVEVRALKTVLQELTCGTSAPFNINVGLMLYNTAGTVDSNSAVSGYIRRRIQPLGPTTSGCSDLIGDLDLIDSKITADEFKGPSSTDYGTALFEAFKYFGGYANTNDVEATAPGSPTQPKGFGPARHSNPTSFEDAGAFQTAAKKYYLSPIGEDSCGQNYIVLIGNQFPNQEYGSNQNATPPTNSVMGYLGLAPSQLYPVSNRAEIRFADEWTQFLARTDVSAEPGHQPLKTFTINVFNKREDLQQTALLNSMAKYGGSGVGGAFKVDGDLGALIAAFRNIFTQIASVNNAFASASLPISVNTQGTYLNQVFIGMFRPDANKRPRWAGNLKQYQFAIRETIIGDNVQRDLYLADANNNPAVDNVNTGFIQACARSIWTKDSTNYWQSVTEAPTPDYEIPRGSCPSFEFNDSPDGGIVERGGAAQQLRLQAPTARTIHTCAASPANCNTLTTLTVTTDDEKWIRGDNVGDGYNTASAAVTETYGKSSTETRPTVHGGVIHSRPLAINYGANGTNDVVVYYGADDGLLRAIDGNKPETSTRAGSELWAFLPPEFVGRLKRNRDNYPLVSFFDDPTSPKDYFFDGSLGGYVGPAKADGTGSAVKYLYTSMRRGGRMIYAFDATQHPATSAPEPMWRFGCPTATNTDCFGGTAASKLGQTWSSPKIVRVRNQVPLYAVFGAGYDRCEDTEPRACSSASTGHGLFVLDATSGGFLRFIDFGSNAGHIVADVVPVDVNNDGYSDVLYATDTLGNLWRVNLSDPNVTGTQTPANWVVTHVAKVADWSTNERSRKFLYAPDIVTLGSYNIVLIGTGNREKPLATSLAAKVKNRFYGFWDEYARTSASSPAFATIDDSTDCDKAGDTVMTSTSCQLMNTTDVTQDYLPLFSSVLTRPRGWVIDLANSTADGPNEQVVTRATTVGGFTYFSTFQAKNPNKCSALGTARGCAVCFLHGGAACDAPVDASLGRCGTFVGGGLPPSPVSGVVEVNGTIVPFIIGGSSGGATEETDGGGVDDNSDGNSDPPKPPPCASAICGDEVAIPIKADRTKVYRYKKID